ncbi:MAG: indole-3-glycerol phosphate synthase TrpC [Oscillospiraceae bacterium]|jgi:indole-3-glycerol phosphate synthase|nr:indole-3-glycerol phosphate synthase TrpC [Oscillospiraceae bacterium]
MILDKLAQSTRVRVERAKCGVTLEEMRAFAEKSPVPAGISFKEAIAAQGLSMICEIKKASPSKGVIAADFPYLEIARQYEQQGAAAVSVLTEPDYFLGDDAYLRAIASSIKIPALRKDFTIDAYQIYEAKQLGARAVLLICALLDDARLEEYQAIAQSIGLDALVETHDAREMERALRANAQIIGANNRNLQTFEVDLQVSVRLRPLVPKDRLFVAESGIRSQADLALMKSIGADAVLVGEAMMRKQLTI